MTDKITDYSSRPGFERKHLPTFIKAYDDDHGIVEHYVAIFGNVDDGNDRILNGAFVKTLVERGNRVKVLDQHQLDSVTCIVGKPLAMREVGREELTRDVLAYAPNATGALLATTQYALNTARGHDVFHLVKGGFAPETSIGYDAVVAEHTNEIGPDGEQKVVRNLKEIRLWEYSNVVFGMNPATATLSAKSAGPSEGKPWRAVHGEDGKWRVYKLDADGQPTGDALGEHETEEEAQAQCRALYASERGGGVGAGAGVPGSGGVTLEAGEGATEEKAPEQPVEDKAGRVLARRNAERIQRALAELNDTLKDAGLLEPPDADEDSDAEKSAAVDTPKGREPNAAPPTPTGAGPDTEPPAYLSAVASLKMLELDLLSLEVQ